MHLLNLPIRLCPGHPTFGHVLGQGFYVEGSLLTGGVPIQVSTQTLHFLLKGQARTLLCALKETR